MSAFGKRMRQMLAAHRLQQMVEAKRQSFETQRFIRNRAAQIQRRSKNEAGNLCTTADLISRRGV